MYVFYPRLRLSRLKRDCNSLLQQAFVLLVLLRRDQSVGLCTAAKADYTVFHQRPTLDAIVPCRVLVFLPFVVMVEKHLLVIVR